MSTCSCLREQYLLLCFPPCSFPERAPAQERQHLPHEKAENHQEVLQGSRLWFQPGAGTPRFKIFEKMHSTDGFIGIHLQILPFLELICPRQACSQAACWSPFPPPFIVIHPLPW